MEILHIFSMHFIFKFVTYLLAATAGFIAGLYVNAYNDKDLKFK